MSPNEKNYSKAFDCALRLLTRREHGALELCDKLQSKGFSRELALRALQSCQELDLQSDLRFVEVYCRSRISQGFGPLKISQELKQKGLDKELISSVLNQEEEHWVDYALDLWQKKNKNPDLSFLEMQKQQRFLLYRGFTPDIIAKVMKAECNKS